LVAMWVVLSNPVGSESAVETQESFFPKWE